MDYGKAIADRKRQMDGTSDRADENAADVGADDTAEGETPEASYDGVENDAVDEMTDILGLKGSDASRFGAALRDYVRACIDKGGGE